MLSGKFTGKRLKNLSFEYNIGSKKPTLNVKGATKK
jgi:hypothetical protein